MHCKNLKTMLATLLCLGALATPALAQFNVSIDIGTPPPPQRYEGFYETYPGYVLVPGFWFWDGHRHRWSEQHWVEARPGHHWAPARWERRGNRHHFEPGRWEPDRHDTMRAEHGRERRENHGGRNREGHGRF